MFVMVNDDYLFDPNRVSQIEVKEGPKPEQTTVKLWFIDGTTRTFSGKVAGQLLGWIVARTQPVMVHADGVREPSMPDPDKQIVAATGQIAQQILQP